MTTRERVQRSFVPVVAPGVDGADIDGEVVLVHLRTGRLHRLDPVGSVIWSFLDGETSIDELAVDLAVGFSTDAAQVVHDVAELVEHLLADGVLVDGREGGGHDDGLEAAPVGPTRAPRRLANPPSP